MSGRRHHIQYYLDQNMAAPVVMPLADGEVAVYSAAAPGRESPNEDAAALVVTGLGRDLLLLADGFGGQPSGYEAACLAVQSVARNVESVLAGAVQNGSREGRGNAVAEGSDHTGNLQAAILAGFDAANAAVFDLGVGAAATLVAVEIRAGIIRPYHVGDSEVLVTGQRGRLKLRTVPHSPAGYAVEAGVVDADDAMHHEERHLVSNMVGSKEMRIEVGAPLKLAPRDTLLVGSDGLYDNLTEDEIIAHIRKGPLARAMAAMVTAARERMIDARPGQPSKADDLTAIAYRRRARPASRGG